MFHSHSPYSPFFTSGLLSARVPDVPTSPRRGSLPTDAPAAPREEDVSAFYFTLQSRRDEDEFRSFLSLDLAESQSMRSASLKRKASASTGRTGRSVRTLSKPSENLFRFPRISEVPLPSPAPASAPLRMRFSRDSLRTIPSPKPAPSITLPDLPKVAQSPPRLPSIQLTPSLDFSFPAVPTHTPTPPRDVARLRLNLNTNLNHRVSVATKASSSTVSTRARKYNRSEALARLEGRSRPATAPLPPPSRIHARPLPTPPALSSSASAKRNFMSMSDDEDSSDDSDADGDNIDDDLSDLDSLDFPDVALLDPSMEPEDMVLPLPAPSPSFLQAPRSAPLPPRSPYSPFPAALHPRRPAPQRSSTAGSDVRAGIAKDWFPLRSFIDLHGESTNPTPIVLASPTTTASTSTSSSLERGPAGALRAEGRRRVYGAHKDNREGRSSGSAGWTWRSFIEVANVS
ncbi:hypothetical protein BDN70DRAFT_898349 [Pholiota conissans]|uniref:Uncharacterized protein n=1 Tax=Pholiota conissans TaxID=109636 RepID=A0A9P5YU77_9AGAR|nr:hypothetical protein BDN70DRAFT_898349 [Pholiota conissans]